MKISEFIGQSGSILKINNWLKNWKPKKALILWGPTGTGKTSIIKALAEEKNLDLIEINASDTRTAETIKNALSSTIKQQSLFKKGKIILIDEIEGLSRIDRGAVKEIIKIIKSSKYPVILTGNNPYEQKFKYLRFACDMVQIKKPPMFLIERYLTSVAKKKNISITKQKIKELIISTNSDIRAALIGLEICYSDKRDNKVNIFETLKMFFESESIKKSCEIIEISDKKPDEILFWILENLPEEFPNLNQWAIAFDLLSKADLFRRKGNWVKILSSISVLDSSRKNVFFKPPQRIWNV